MALNPIYIDSATAGATLSVGTINSSTINIGNANSSTNLAGITNSAILKTTSIEPITSGGNLNIGSSINTGPISIETSSNLNTNGAPAISIGTTPSIKTIKIGNSAPATPNTVTVAETVFFGNTMNNITNGDMFIGNAQTTGVIHIGTGGGVVRSGPVNIATTNNSTSTINVGANLTLTNLNGNNYIARNTTGTNPTYIEMNSGTTFNLIDFHCNSAYNRDYDARITCGGGTATDGQGDLAITSKSLSISCPLTLGSTPTGSTQIGWIIAGTFGTVANPASVAIPTAGIWLFTWNITFDCGGAATTWGYSQISGANVPKNQSFPVSMVNSSNSIGTGGSIVVVATVSTYTLQFYGSSTAYSISTGYSYLQAVRIA